MNVSRSRSFVASRRVASRFSPLPTRKLRIRIIYVSRADHPVLPSVSLVTRTIVLTGIFELMYLDVTSVCV